MDKQEITAEARALGTFEISAEPDQDCCTLFVPRHPSTRVSPEEIHALEAKLDLERLVQAGVTGAQEETFAFPASAGPYPPLKPAASLPHDEPNI
jgi:thiamine biosynthesis protein ThiI